MIFPVAPVYEQAAFELASSSSQELSIDLNAAHVNYPISFECWVVPRATGTMNWIMLDHTTGTGQFLVFQHLTGSIRAKVTGDSSGSRQFTGAGWTVGTPVHVVCVFISDSDRRIFVDGQRVQHTATLSETVTVNRCRIGDSNTTIDVGACAFWAGYGLSDPEARSLYHGTPWWTIRPDKIAAGPEVVSQGDVFDHYQRKRWTLTNTPRLTGPLGYSEGDLGLYAPVAAAGGPAMPLLIDQGVGGGLMPLAGGLY